MNVPATVVDIEVHWVPDRIQWNPASSKRRFTLDTKTVRFAIEDLKISRIAVVT